MPLSSRSLPRRPLLALVFAVLCVSLSGAATMPQEASAKVRFGYGDARPDMFTDPLWQRLPLRHVRRLVDWDTPRRPEKLAKLDDWMAQAQATGAIPLLAIDKSWTEGQEKKRPSVAQYERLIEFLKDRYPWWKRLTPWNEANHSAQPTYRSPRLAWLYYLAARRACTGCTLTAPGLVVGRTLSPVSNTWLARFQAYARGRVNLWAVHNYGDMNRGDRSGLERVERAVRGQIWITEAGGWVQFLRNGKYPYDLQRSVRGIRNTFRLMATDPRIDYIYFYQWRGAPTRDVRWDTGVLNFDGTPRPGYYALEEGLEEYGLGVME